MQTVCIDRRHDVVCYVMGDMIPSADFIALRQKCTVPTAIGPLVVGDAKNGNQYFLVADRTLTGSIINDVHMNNVKGKQNNCKLTLDPAHLRIMNGVSSPNVIRIEATRTITKGDKIAHR